MEELTDESIMPFGKHKGKTMEEVPAAYLMWIWNENCDQFKHGDITRMSKYTVSVLTYIADNMDVIEHEIKNQKR